MSTTTELANLGPATGLYNALQHDQPLPTPSQHFSSPGSHQAASTAISTRISSESQLLTQREVDDKPWKYIGYEGYSNFLASETDFLAFRRFGVVSTRIILRLQDRVVILQEKLEKLDRQFNRREAEDIHNGSFRQEDKEREQVLDELQIALSEYSKSL
jgi:hypothetical protein